MFFSHVIHTTIDLKKILLSSTHVDGDLIIMAPCTDNKTTYEVLNTVPIDPNNKPQNVRLLVAALKKLLLPSDENGKIQIKLTAEVPALEKLIDNPSINKRITCNEDLLQITKKYKEGNMNVDVSLTQDLSNTLALR